MIYHWSLSDNDGEHMGRPKKAWRNKGIDIAAWENDRGGVSFTFRKTYKDKETQQYKETKYLFAQDLRDLHTLLSEVIDWNHNLAERETHEAEAAASGADAMKQRLEREDDMIPF